jgi:hypothetical protein
MAFSNDRPCLTRHPRRRPEINDFDCTALQVVVPSPLGLRQGHAPQGITPETRTVRQRQGPLALDQNASTPH